MAAHDIAKRQQGRKWGLRKILFTKITDRAANIFWLFVLWCGIYAFTVWNYGSWHWLRASPNYGGYAILIGWILLAIQFSLNFPAKRLIIRIVCGLAALVFLLAALPTF